MALEIAALAAAGSPVALTAGYGAGLGNAAAFQGALADAGRAQAAGAAAAPGPAASRAPADIDAVTPALKGMFQALERVNGQAREVGDFARTAAAQGREMTPGEIVQLTMRCHEFMFHCQLSSSIANRTSDGLQQLFRQQS